MLRNYLKIALRTLWKNRTHTLVNVIGLSVAFASAVLLFLTAHFEWSFDRFHQHRGAIHRLSLKEVHPEKVDYQTNMPIPMMPALQANYPDQIPLATRLESSEGQLTRRDRIWNGDVSYVDGDFLEMFSFPLLKGNAQTALGDLNGLVLNERVAAALFGKDEPVGQLLTVNIRGQKKAFVVRGVIANAPVNSTISNNVLMRFENFADYQMGLTLWNWRTHDVYVKLAGKVDGVSFEKQLQPFIRRQYAKEIDQLKREGARPDERGELISLRLTPLAAVHFDRLTDNKAIDPVYPRVLLGISLLIILIAGINFVNLSIARSVNRAKEVGMRKALGAVSGQIMGQFGGEAVLICLLSLSLGLLLVVGLISPFNALFAGQLSLSQLAQPVVLAWLLAGFGLICLLAGGYPAWLVARVNAVDVLKGSSSQRTRAGGMRNALIIIQFMISVLLIGCSLVVWQQIDYVRNKPLGYQPEQVVSIPVGYEVNGYRALAHFRSQLANQPQIISISGADGNLGKGKDGAVRHSVYGFMMDGKSYQTNSVNVDFDYLETLGLKLWAGRSFSRQFTTDSTSACVINTSMARQLGIRHPVGTVIPLADERGKTIIGVVDDYHFASLHDQIEPMTLFFNKPFGLAYLFVRVRANAPATTMALLERTYRSIAPKSPFTGTFLDENVNNQYNKEQRLATVFVSAAWLAILLSCVGLFAIALMTIQTRTKEIGVRKVLGASVFSIVSLLSKDFLKLVLIAIVIASPLAWWAMNKWLQDFAYRIDIEWWVFALAGLLAVGIALLTVSFQSIRAALMNPVQSIRSE